MFLDILCFFCSTLSAALLCVAENFSAWTSPPGLLRFFYKKRRPRCGVLRQDVRFAVSWRSAAPLCGWMDQSRIAGTSPLRGSKSNRRDFVQAVSSAGTKSSAPRCGGQSPGGAVSSATPSGSKSNRQDFVQSTTWMVSKRKGTIRRDKVQAVSRRMSCWVTESPAPHRQDFVLRNAERRTLSWRRTPLFL
jgi:hypothetical protein